MDAFKPAAVVPIVAYTAGPETTLQVFTFYSLAHGLKHGYEASSVIGAALVMGIDLAATSLISKVVNSNIFSDSINLSSNLIDMTINGKTTETCINVANNIAKLNTHILDSITKDTNCFNLKFSTHKSKISLEYESGYDEMMCRSQENQLHFFYNKIIPIEKHILKDCPAIVINEMFHHNKIFEFFMDFLDKN